MNKIQAKNMLNDVVEHFSSNPTELRSKSSRGCFYNSQVNKPKSIGCAIGMYISNENAIYLDDHCGSIDAAFDDGYIDNLTLYSKLPKWMQKMDVNFLSDIQNLHDSDVNWTNTTISEKGKQTVQAIIKQFQL